MPTGYTYGVRDGTVKTLEQFAAVCVKNFIMGLRDKPDNEPLPDKIPTPNIDHYTQNIELAKCEMNRLVQLSSEELAKVAAEEQLKEFDRKKAYYENAESGLENYKNMIRLVKAWQAPPECAHLKCFMLEQLESSCSFDYPAPFDYVFQPKSAPLWLADKVLECLKTIEYNTDYIKHEIDRAEKENEYLQKLKGSLNGL